MRVRIAAAQYPIDEIKSFEALRTKLTWWVEEAARERAQLLVFPEYGAMELAALFGPTIARDLHAQIGAVSGIVADVDALHAELAARHGVFILAASLPILGSDGQARNTARLFTPGGKQGAQEKLIMTRFERESWGIAAGGPVRVFATALGRIGVSICYDAEFPLIARAQAEAGAEIILVPSCTDGFAGYSRVRIAARARALENQCVTVQSPTVGHARWSPAVDVNVGAAALFGPPDHGFPADGIIAEGALDRAMWVYGEADLQQIAAVRRDGQVLNHAHWREQPGASALAAEIVDLT